MATETCPCGTQIPYAECCEPSIKGSAQPQTAVALMRARYTAFVRQEIDYLMDTLSPARKLDIDRPGVEEWSRNTAWAGLEIVSSDKGGPGDDTGSVEFIARYREGDALKEHHELATFVKQKGKWLFDDGKAPPVKTVRHEGPRIGRNDPCHCGSGKKFKKCHGAAAAG